MSKFIGVSGFARSGKDTFYERCKIFLEKEGKKVCRFGFADALKEECDELLGKYTDISAFTENNSEKKLQDAIYADERAIDLACRFGYSVPNAYKSLGGALKELIEKTRKKKKRSFFEDRLDALRKSAEKARSELPQQEGSEKSVSSENVYGQ